MRAGIDLSLRSTGIAIDTPGIHTFRLVKLTEYDEEELLLRSCKRIMSILREFGVTQVNLEGLSFGSVSSSKDIIAGNFWMLRCALHEAGIEVNILPVSMWRSPLFTAADRHNLKHYAAVYTELKKEIKAVKTRAGKLKLIQDNLEAIEGSSVKIQTFLKCPDDVRAEILKVASDAGKFDLADAYFLCECSKKSFTNQ